MDTNSSKRTVEYSHLLSVANLLDGCTLKTNARGARFKVGVHGEKILFTPFSTGKQRPEYPSSIEKVLSKYHVTGSMAPSDYTNLTGNSVYLLKLISIIREDWAYA